MSEKIVSDKLKLAAKRAALKTMAQTARPAGAAIVTAIGASVFGVDWALVAGTAGASIITVVWAGADAYLDKMENGLPDEYVAAGIEQEKNRQL